MLNPTGSLDLRRLTYSLALVSPASKWVTPFCSGTCLATFSLWKLKNTNLPKKRDRPVLRLITSGALSSAFMLKLPVVLLVVVSLVVLALLERGLRPWKEMLHGDNWCFWMVVVEEKVGVNKVEEGDVAW